MLSSGSGGLSAGAEAVASTSKTSTVGASTSSSSSSSTYAQEKSSTRLYVGNLHPSVDEYTLIQIFSKHGKLAKLDYLFHKSGPHKGKPRGYAFVEYGSKEEAMQALVATNDKMLRGRKVSVTFANKSDYAEMGSAGLGPHRHRHGEASKPTTLSLIKNAQKPKSTNAKIAAMEAKLRLLQEQKSSANGGEGGTAASSSLQPDGASQLRAPPRSAGLPSKPPPSIPGILLPPR